MTKYDFSDVKKMFAVDSCFVFNAVNLNRTINFNPILKDLVVKRQNIYKYYKENNLELPKLLKNNFFAQTSTDMRDGVKEFDYWRVHYYYNILAWCNKADIDLVVLPTVYNEITFNPNKPRTNYKDTTVVDSVEYKKLFKTLLVKEEDFEAFRVLRESLAQEYLNYGVMKPVLDSETGKPVPTADARNLSEAANLGLILLTSDSDYIAQGGNNHDRARAIKEINQSLGYIYSGTNGISLYTDWVPEAMDVSFLYHKMQKSTKKISFAINISIITEDDELVYQDSSLTL